MRVYRAIKKIPPGRVSGYGEVARYISCGSPRAIGQALAHNPFAPEVPCHRVVAANGDLRGFQGKEKKLSRKRALLENEGVPFLPCGRVAPEAFYTF